MWEASYLYRKMKKYKLTMKQLNEMMQGEICRGEMIDNPDGFHINGTGKLLKWVAMRGSINDWCIYTESCWEDMDYETVITNGNKISPEMAKKVIDGSEEVWQRYRR